MTQDYILLNFRYALSKLYMYKSVLVRREYLQETLNVQIFIAFEKLPDRFIYNYINELDFILANNHAQE